MNEREQMVVLKLWIDHMTSQISPSTERLTKIKNYNLIISFVLSELSGQFSNKWNEKGQIMLEIKGILEFRIKT